ncbi:hypothetical protein Arub01_35350 [Actinomadura rubrobrunea]|uniref:CBM6 domain-containing protein n=1 Tax=Actinomadura rubrobrunea TaxID=115335 RepID=A0A9W6PY28_9ACTN|nr:family 43 glycosylhydrolase [Actinomadura rubrobrunea]GLW65291.1 hypothetical protein Arub01_35350 [Actinomadura rubrobrunea]
MSYRPLLAALSGALVCTVVAVLTAVITEGDGPDRRPRPTASATATEMPAPVQSPMSDAGPANGPALDSNFPDPEVLKAGDAYFAYATNDGGKNVPVAKAPSALGPWSRTDADALPALPAWAQHGRTWAPDVSVRSDGSYLLYFTAMSRDGGQQCIGAATASSPLGPFTPQGTSPLVCRRHVDTIDPAAFVDSDGARYLLYKQGGEHGGLYLQRTSPDGLRLDGSPVRILTKGDDEPSLIEAPALVKHGGTYVLFYAAGVFYRSDYQTRYATASSITGPYTKAPRPLLSTDGYRKEITGPGGADIVHDGTDSHLVFHGIAQFLGGDSVRRAMYVAELGWADGTPVVRGSPVRYEAENGRVYGARIRRVRDGVSGGAAVDDMDNAQSLAEVDVYAPRMGDYLVRVRYANHGDDAAHMLTVNGGAPVVVRYPGSSGRWRDVEIEVALRAGWNVLRLARQFGNAELDYIEVS